MTTFQGSYLNFVEAEPHIASLHTPASSARLQLAPLFGLSETYSSPLSSFVFLSLHFASWRWGIDQKQNGWAVLQDPPVLTDFKPGWDCACVAWLRVCLHECLSACMCAICMYMQIYVCAPEYLYACKFASVPPFFFFQPEKWIPTKTSPHNVATELPRLQCELVVIVPCFLSSGSRSSGSRVTYLRDSSSSWSLWIRIGSRKSSAVKVHYVVLVRNLNRRGKIFIDNLFVFMTE